VLRFHRTQYHTIGGQHREATWWQIGSLILRHRDRSI
jgi:hypothetical protein